MNDIVTGTVSKVYQNDRHPLTSVVMGDGTKYSSYNKVDGFDAGDEVQFKMKQNGAYKNITGAVTVLGAGGGASVTPLPTSASQPVEKGFPTNRSIQRQNALTNAVKYVLDTRDPDEHTPNDVIEVAWKFEQYTSGQLTEEMLDELFLQTPEMFEGVASPS